MSEQEILLGSGKLSLGVVANVATATETEIAAALTEVGAISGGATLTYTPTFKEIKSANYGTLASFLTDEQVTFTSGILNWNLKNLENFSAGAYSEDETAGTRRIGIGGLRNVPINYLRFEHTKPSGKKLTVNIFKAQSQNGFELAFDSENETIIDAQFKALAVPGKTDGTLVEIVEEI
ncbi:hypothetical protein P9E34_14125 [Schinkia azotoformans]|uniref:hypothetical protein n=1 Tax=Schinkia azotoformans TaxID=1454 RepID=UPI002DB937A6|nr:hypothetical protein [Schinkia azotoformans]MEC1725851.1 hypothetical protein [Schinkia azotoformans]